jgi:hypothetical protein
MGADLDASQIYSARVILARNAARSFVIVDSIEIPGGHITHPSRPPRLCGESPPHTPERLSLTLAVRLCLRVAAIGQSVCKALTRESQPPIQQERHSESGHPGRFC